MRLRLFFSWLFFSWLFLMRLGLIIFWLHLVRLRLISPRLFLSTPKLPHSFPLLIALSANLFPVRSISSLVPPLISSL
ncbi:hypothetical protein BDV97DRAFT_343606 [Delphinella strobiligena]|nr:hypothetical protein BDV97DRAFT_343606 [Delphinella strobiligena]